MTYPYTNESRGVRRTSHLVDRPPGRSRERPGGYALPDLEDVLHELNPLPHHAVFLGICEDGLPLLLELTNPEPGALLIASDHESANRSLLRVALASVVWMNSPGDVRVSCVTSQASGFDGLDPQGRQITFVSPFRAEFPERVRRLSDLAAQRANGRQRGPVQILLLDGLEEALPQLDERSQEALRWLIGHGARAGIWVFASLNLEWVTTLDDRVLQVFGTRLLGPMQSTKVAAYLSGAPDLRTAGLVPGLEYCVRTGGDLVKFWIPGLTPRDSSGGFRGE